MLSATPGYLRSRNKKEEPDESIPLNDEFAAEDTEDEMEDADAIEDLVNEEVEATDNDGLTNMINELALAEEDDLEELLEADLQQELKGQHDPADIIAPSLEEIWIFVGG